MLPSAQTSAWTYLSLTETTCTACGCSAAAPLNSVPISFSTVLEWCMGGGGGGGGGGATGDLHVAGSVANWHTICVQA